MSCPFVGLATRATAGGDRLTVRICGAVPYERNDDPGDLPLPSVCFSDEAYTGCYHYRVLMKRQEVAAWVTRVSAPASEVAPLRAEAVAPFQYKPAGS